MASSADTKITNIIDKSIGCLLLLSASLKLVSPDGSYSIMYYLDVINVGVEVLAYIIIALEFSLGIMLITGKVPGHIKAIIGLLFIAGSLLLIGSTEYMLNLDCGCFGVIPRSMGLIFVASNVVIFGALIYSGIISNTSPYNIGQLTSIALIAVVMYGMTGKGNILIRNIIDISAPDKAPAHTIISSNVYDYIISLPKADIRNTIYFYVDPQCPTCEEKAKAFARITNESNNNYIILSKRDSVSTHHFIQDHNITNIGAVIVNVDLMRIEPIGWRVPSIITVIDENKLKIISQLGN